MSFSILSHKPTSRCGCRCLFCDSWVDQASSADWLPDKVVLRMLEQARRAGVEWYFAWGGEPLMIETLPRWLEHARELGMKVGICTAADLFADRASLIAPLTDLLILSIEGIGAEHDRMRGVPGLFDTWRRGLDAARSVGTGRILLWSNISHENVASVDALAKLAADERVEIAFFPSAVFPGYNEQICLDLETRRTTFERIKRLRFLGYPVANLWPALDLMGSSASFECDFVRLKIHVTAEGNIWACEPRVSPNLQPISNVNDVDLSDPSFLAEYASACAALTRCNACLMPCVADAADGRGGFF